MKYDEFLEKLEQYEREFRKAFGREMATIGELKEFLARRKVGRRRDGALKSLRGLGI